MFNTFRHINSGNRLGLWESVLPPFDRKRQGKLTRVACTHCRSKKLKCTEERNGCRRCRLKKLDCIYPRPSSPKAPSKTKDQERTSHTDRHPLSAGSRVGAAYSREPTATNELMIEEGFADGNHKPDQMGTLHVANHYLWNVTSPEEVHNLDTSTINYLTQDASFFSIPFFRDPQQDTEKAHGGGCPPEPASKPGTNSKSTPCSCLSQILRTFETVQLATVLGLQDTPEAFYSNAHNTLCLQKDALASCETLLECPTCSSQSEHITMVTYISDRMLTSIRDLVLSMTRSVAYQDGLISSQSGSYGDPRDTGLEIRRWKLDNEDEMQVLRSLVNVQITKLSSLLNKLDKIVMIYHLS